MNGLDTCARTGGYDSSETIVKLWSYGIKSIIDIRNLWKRSYNERSALEQINSRLDRVYGFEVHTHRPTGG